MRYVAVAAAIIAATSAFAQEQLVTVSQSWEDWQPPVVEMPEPNAYDQYQIAFDMLEGFEAPEQDATDEELRASIQGFEPAYQALQQAQEGECRFPPLMAPGQLFPELSGARNAARFMATLAQVNAVGGRTAQAALDCVACVRIGSAAASNGTLIGGLVAVACEGLGLRELAEIIPALQPAECQAVIEALQAAEAQRVALPVVLQGELVYGKMMMKGQFAGMESPDHNQEQFMALTPEQREEALLQWQETLRQMGLVTWDPDSTWTTHEEWFEGVIEETAKPYWARADILPSGDPLVDALVPACDKTQVTFAIADAKLRLALCQLAVRSYMATEDGPPETLDALAPDYLPEVPNDPFRDATLSSATLDGEFVIYSVGPDGEDSGGAAIEGPADADSEGDMVVRL